MQYFTKQFLLKPSNVSGIPYNFIAFTIIITVFIFIAWGAKQITAPISVLELQPVSLKYAQLFVYSLRTILRMLIALIISLVFTIIYGCLAAKSKRLERILIPLLDILQSVPILGYISFTVTAFLSLFPGSVMGAECAAIFAIFTSQSWNMTFSFYQSLKTLPQELNEVASIFRMSKWRKFWQIEVPYAIPALVWNIVVSMSSGWFFVVASEVITVGNQSITLPGIGSYIALAINNKNFVAIIAAIIAMSLIIILYDQVLLRPLVAWSDRFHYDMTSTFKRPQSWVLNAFRRSILIPKLLLPFHYIAKFLLYFQSRHCERAAASGGNQEKQFKKTINHGLLRHAIAFLAMTDGNRYITYLWNILLISIAIFTIYHIIYFLHNVIGWSETVYVFFLASITLLRVIVLVMLASIVWVPIGIYIGLRPRLTSVMQPLAQFLAAFPVNILFPITFIFISRYDLNPNIWLSPLMIMGTQWYILFNVIVGASLLPNDLREVTSILKVKGWRWWQKIMLPAIAPNFIIGALTASGGAWNASIVAEVINFGGNTMQSVGLGSYIAMKTVAADFHKIVLGIGMMSCFVVCLNRLFWRPLNEYIIRRFQM